MDERIKPADGRSDLPGVLRSWVMIALTLVFVLLYALALTGWLKPLADERMIVRLEPVIFVIIGYYFGRLPAQATEHTLKGEIDRQTKKADAAQHSKEQAQLTTEALEEKVKNARAMLTSTAFSGDRSGQSATVGAAAAPGGDALRHSVNAAINILHS